MDRNVQSAKPAKSKAVRGLPRRAKPTKTNDLEVTSPMGDARAMPSREQAIAQAAYLLSERDGFPAGRDLEYWLRAEADYDTRPVKP
jgi:Protein of unknown function (DUF2934)